MPEPEESKKRLIEQAVDRALETYQKKGYSDEWIHQRILSIRVRNALTEEWQKSGVQQGREYAILTDEITKAWPDMELILNMLAESTSTEISKQQNPTSLAENIKIARSGGEAEGRSKDGCACHYFSKCSSTQRSCDKL